MALITCTYTVCIFGVYMYGFSISDTFTLQFTAHYKHVKPLSIILINYKYMFHNHEKIKQSREIILFLASSLAYLKRI